MLGCIPNVLVLKKMSEANPLIAWNAAPMKRKTLYINHCITITIPIKLTSIRTIALF